MFERFTDRARRVVVLAQEESRLLGHNYIGTEHLLLGLVDEGAGVGAQILDRLGAPAPAVREAVISLAEAEPESPAARPEAGIRAFPGDVRLPLNVLVEFREMIASIDRRLAAIERHLGIADSPAAGEEPPAASEQ